MKPDISLIISFYKNTRFLKLILAALKLQTFKNFEVIISDDGSPEEIVNQVKDWLILEKFDFQYIWHEDNGFRKTMILNKSVVAAKSDYLVFLDGDCIPHLEFIREHYHAKEKGVIRAGRRVDLSQVISDKLTVNQVEKGYLGFSVLRDLFKESIASGLRGMEQGIYIKNKPLRKIINRKGRGIRGHNYGMFKSDLLSVNGFDERFVKPGVGEDTDLEARILRAGMKIKGITKQAIVYHQYHKLLPRESDIYDVYYQNNKEGITYTPYGIKRE